MNNQEITSVGQRFDFELVEQYVEQGDASRYEDRHNFLIFKDTLSLYIMRLFDKRGRKEKNVYLKLKLNLGEGCITQILPTYTPNHV
jgi:hypothetical protein